MYQRTELFSNLAEEEIASTLSACTLTDKEEYTEFEADRFREARDLVGQGKSYKQVAAHFRQLDRKKKQHNGDSEVVNPEPTLNISSLLALAASQCSTRISFKEVGQILEACGLPETDEYSSEEGDRFLEACDLIKQQGKTIEEVAAHFGVEGEVAAAKNIEAGIEQTASALDSSGNGVVSEVMRYKAKVDASAAPSFYLQHLAEEFGSPEFQSAWGQMEEGLKASVLGKSQKRVRQMIGEQRSHLRSLPPSNILPSASED